MAADKLLNIPESEWTELRDYYYKVDRTTSIGYAVIDNFIKWHANHPEEDIQFYTLNGDWRTDGTYLILHKFSGMNQIYFNTRDDSLTPLSRMLSCLQPPEVNYLFCSFPKRLRPAVEQYLAERQLTDKARIEAAYWHHGPKELIESFKPTPPAGITLAPIDVKHAAQINEIWPHRAPGSVHFVELLLRNNVNVGAFDAAGNLVAWCLRLPQGALGVLQVTEPYKRTGMGSLVVSYLSQQISALGNGVEVLAPVVCTNTPSLKMFEKLGFKIIDEVSWALVPASQ